MYMTHGVSTASDTYLLHAQRRPEEEDWGGGGGGRVGEMVANTRSTTRLPLPRKWIGTCAKQYM